MRADLWPLFVADVGHDKLFCEEFCAGADVPGETHSRAVLGHEVRGTMSTRGRMWGTRSTGTGVPMGYSEYPHRTTACCQRSAARW